MKRTIKVTCVGCDRDKQDSAFYPQQVVCKDCSLSAGKTWCGGCAKMKPLKDFYKDKRRKSGTYQLCKPCCRRYDSKGLQRWRISTKYGITVEQYETMLQSQKGVCKICKRPERRKRLGKTISLHIDHCHATGKVRGLLCTDCNLGIGRFHDKPDMLEAAAEYLRNATG